MVLQRRIWGRRDGRREGGRDGGNIFSHSNGKRGGIYVDYTFSEKLCSKIEGLMLV